MSSILFKEESQFYTKSEKILWGNNALHHFDEFTVIQKVEKQRMR